MDLKVQFVSVWLVGSQKNLIFPYVFCEGEKAPLALLAP